MKTPTHLKHKPILEVADYDQIDGHRANNTDAKCLSLGIAQWNDGLGTELSAKVWRQVDERWSRQSEELPLNRVLDLATLICDSKLYADGKSFSSESDFLISKVSGSEWHDKILNSEFNKNKEYLDKSFKRLAKALKALGY
ncbi:TPA: DUF6530 family protein [Vibrio parahaemolyticus]